MKDSNNCSFTFLNHDYTEEDEKDEFIVFFIHLIHLLQCNHDSKKQNEQFGTHLLNFESSILKWGFYFSSIPM